MWRGSRLNRPKPQIDKVIFLIVPIPLPNWQVMDIKQRLYNTLIPIPYLLFVWSEIRGSCQHRVCPYRLPPLQHRYQLNMPLAANVAIKRTSGWPTNYWRESLDEFSLNKSVIVISVLYTHIGVYVNGVHARGHVTLSTSIGKALDFRFLEKGSTMLCLWLPMDVDRVTWPRAWTPLLWSIL